MRRTARGNDAEHDEHQKPIYVLVNPFGGRKLAAQIWRNKARPVFDAADVRFELHETTHAGHAAEIGAALDFSKYAGFVTCSGDGLLWESLQGVMQRRDWRHVLESTPFGIIPAGSGNGLASSLGILDPAVAAAAICKGVARPADLAAVRQRAADGAVTTWWSILMMTWGLIADCDIGSEHLRMLGGARFTVAGVQRISKMHQYPGRVAILPASADDAEAPPRCDGPLGQCRECDTKQRTGEYVRKSDDNATDEGDGASSSSTRVLKLDGSKVKLGSTRGAATAVQSRVPPDFSFDSPPPGWQVLPQRNFLLVLAMNHSHLSYDAYVTPQSHISDGKLDVIAVSESTRGEAVNLMLKLDSGKAFSSPAVAVNRKVFAMVVEPTDAADLGIMDADGERLPAVQTSIEVYRSMMKVFCKVHSVRDAGN
jgi:sphingosine kinase